MSQANQRPAPRSAEAIEAGCTCAAKRKELGAVADQFGDNFTIIDPKCPLHGGVDALIEMATATKKRRPAKC